MDHGAARTTAIGRIGNLTGSYQETARKRFSDFAQPSGVASVRGAQNAAKATQIMLTRVATATGRQAVHNTKSRSLEFHKDRDNPR
jgi:hypothetical protein